MAVGHAAAQAPAPQRPVVEPRHLGGGARLIDEGQAGGFEVQLALEPRTTPRKNIGTLLLRCMG